MQLHTAGHAGDSAVQKSLWLQASRLDIIILRTYAHMHTQT